jgi:hypothetical protein
MSAAALFARNGIFGYGDTAASGVLAELDKASREDLMHTERLLMLLLSA